MKTVKNTNFEFLMKEQQANKNNIQEKAYKDIDLSKLISESQEIIAILTSIVKTSQKNN